MFCFVELSFIIEPNDQKTSDSRQTLTHQLPTQWYEYVEQGSFSLTCIFTLFLSSDSRFKSGISKFCTRFSSVQCVILACPAQCPDFLTALPYALPRTMHSPALRTALSCALPCPKHLTDPHNELPCAQPCPAYCPA